MGKVAIFIDGGYFDHVLDFHGRLRVDYEKLFDELSKSPSENSFRNMNDPS